MTMPSSEHAPWLIAKPTSPSIWDDEFEGVDIDPKWTTSIPGGLDSSLVKQLDPYTTSIGNVHLRNVNRTRQSWLLYQPTGNYPTSLVNLQQTGSFPTNAFFWARCSVSTRNASIVDGDGEIAMQIWNEAAGAGTNYFYVSLDTFTNIIEGFAGRQVSGVFTVMGLVRNYFNDGFPLEYIGIQKVGATYHGWVATSTGNWIWLGSHTFAVDNFDKIQLVFRNASIASPGRMIIGCDFFRVFDGKGPP